uniref:AIG1-type G domain-containing protein n=1 Tax=Oreochromis niloticus TaxID=8128 RepID=A0A669DFU7_ORENI
MKRRGMLGDQPKRDRDRRLLLLGGPRSGKTSTANTILGDEVFDGGAETTHSNVGHTEIYGRRVTVVDTPPWAIPADPDDDAERIRQESQRGAALLRPGPHTLLLVLEESSYSSDNTEPEDDCRGCQLQ